MFLVGNGTGNGTDTGTALGSDSLDVSLNGVWYPESGSESSTSLEPVLVLVLESLFSSMSVVGSCLRCCFSAYSSVELLDFNIPLPLPLLEPSLSPVEVESDDTTGSDKPIADNSCGLINCIIFACAARRVSKSLCCL